MSLTKSKILALAAFFIFSSTCMADRADVDRNISQLKLPDGFSIEVYAEVPQGREMALDKSTGTVFVGTFNKQVYAIFDKNHDHKADDVHIILDNLKLANGVAVNQDMLYVAEQNRVSRYPITNLNSNQPLKAMRQIIYDQLPDKFHHGWRYITFGPDNKLYIAVGAPCNICYVKGIEGTIIRMNPDGSHVEVFAKGIRNSVGMTFHPDTGHLFFTDNNTDKMGDDIPPGELNIAPEKGMHFGFPYYAGGHVQHPRWQDKQTPQKMTFPVVEFQAHSANLGLKFYTGDMFPSEYKGDAFVAQHGSWNRSSPVGYQVVRVKFNKQHQSIGYEPFISGWLIKDSAWGRPVDILQLTDGSLLISDDMNGVIYRVSHNSKTVSIANLTKTNRDINKH